MKLRVVRWLVTLAAWMVMVMVVPGGAQEMSETAATAQSNPELSNPS